MSGVKWLIDTGGGGGRISMTDAKEDLKLLEMDMVGGAWLEGISSGHIVFLDLVISICCFFRDLVETDEATREDWTAPVTGTDEALGFATGLGSGCFLFRRILGSCV
jgi:hypothetical protein